MNTIQGEIKWNDFQKIEMRIGTILNAEHFKAAKQPAIKLKIDFGPLGVLSSSAQITDLYNPDQLIGKQVIAVLNFPPKQIATMMSECLVLAAVDGDKGTSLISPDHNMPNGTKIS